MTVKFSVQIENQFGYNWDQTKEIITKTEEHGFHSFVSDLFCIGRFGIWNLSRKAGGKT